MSNDTYHIRHFTGNDVCGYPLRSRLFLIGSGADNDIVVRNTALPAIILRIDPEDGRYRCTAASREAFCINGKKVSSALLNPGDVITIKKERFSFDCTAALIPPTSNRDPLLLEHLRAFINAVGRERSLDTLLQKMINVLLRLTHGTDIFIFKLNRDGMPQIFKSNNHSTIQERFSDTIIQAVLQRQEGIFLSNALDDPAFKNSQSIADLQLKSVLCTPVITAGKCIGLIYIGCNAPDISYSRRDLDSINLYAAIAGMLFQHIDFLTEQQHALDVITANLDENGLIATCTPMQKVTAAVHAIAGTDISVLITGETGTGKNRIAEQLHKHSSRAAKPFIIVNCSALHGELLESELFGHLKGSFTGAIYDRQGLFAAANGGTLFFDEIGELEPALQAKLLRTLETGTIRPVGSNAESFVNVRVLFATNRNLIAMVNDGTFRTDLYYRINQFSITAPPLRERSEDIILLAYYFLNRYQAQYPDKGIRDFHPDTIDFIKTYDWPGNIREMANQIHRSILMSTGSLATIDRQEHTPLKAEPTDFETATQLFQKKLIEKAICAAGGSKEQAAAALGLSRSTFYRYLAQYKYRF